MQVYVINRDVDADRLARFAAAAAARGVAFRRVPALDAHAPAFSFAEHRALIGPHFWGAPEAKPGAIGCFLSHRRAWATLLDSGAPRALICEDDAVLHEGPGRLSDAACALGADLLFANDRLSAWCAAAGGGAHLPLPAVIQGLAARGGPAALGLKRAPGADCYLLTRRGAARLLDLTAAQRIVCGVDWAMLWNALGPPACAPAAGAAFPELRLLAAHLAPTDPPLEAVVLARPVGGQAGGRSVLRHSLTRRIDDLFGPAG